LRIAVGQIIFSTKKWIIYIYIYHSFKTGSGGWPGPRPGFRVLTRLPGWFFLKKKKSKRHRFSKKKTKKIKVNGFAIRSAGSTPGFSFPRFFFNPTRFQPRVNPPGRVSKLWYIYTILFLRKGDAWGWNKKIALVF